MREAEADAQAVEVGAKAELFQSTRRAEGVRLVGQVQPLPAHNENSKLAHSLQRLLRMCARKGVVLFFCWCLCTHVSWLKLTCCVFLFQAEADVLREKARAEADGVGLLVTALGGDPQHTLGLRMIASGQLPAIAKSHTEMLSKASATSRP